MGAGIAAFRRQWEGQVVDGFPLHQYLGGGHDSAVFLTEYGRQRRRAAVKLVSADPAADLRLSRWRMASKLSHPHLTLPLRFGRCQLDDTPLLYLVMEHAEEDLSQVLPHRPLTVIEAREMLEPALGALGYLHRQGLVHGHLKPANIMAVDDELRISSDRLCRIGDRGVRLAEPGVYDPPEAASAGISPAGDVWSLGVVLVESLTQRLPVWNEAAQPEPVLPEALPDPFLDIARHCLQTNPQSRWTVAQIAAHLREPGSVVSQPVRARPSYRFPKLLYIAPAAVLGLAATVLLLGRKGPASPSNTGPSNTSPSNIGAAPVAHIEPAKPPKPPAEIIHQVVPEVPRKATSTIRGKVTVKVKVKVAPTGGVADVKLDSSGASKYFAGLAIQAARQWKFSPLPSDQEWNLRFEFGKNGTKVYPVRLSP